MQQIVIVTNKNQKSYTRRWRKLNDNSAKLDFERAQLATDVRNEFPKGISGDLQFKEFVTEHFGCRGRSAIALLDSVRAMTLFPTEAEWKTVGGWQSMSFLVALKRGDRRRLFKAVKAKTDKLGRSISYTTVRTTGLGLKKPIHPASGRGGRPTQTKTEEKLSVLRSLVLKLYENYDGLPKLTKAHHTALGGVLADIKAALAE